MSNVTYADTPQFTSISFNEIPGDMRTPGVFVEFDNSNAISGPSIQPFKNLIVGQRLANGTVAALSPVRITNAETAAVNFGAGSMLAAMAAAHFTNNEFTETWAVALDDLPAGAVASGSILYGGTITAGTLHLYIAGDKLTVGVTSTDTLDDIATATVAAITAATHLPVTAAVDGVTTSRVNLTAKHIGEVGNDLDIRFNFYAGEELPVGLTTTITAMVGGTGNPDADEIWPVLGDDQFNIIAFPYSDLANLADLEAELLDRWGPTKQNDGMASIAKAGLFSGTGAYGAARNSQNLNAMGTAPTFDPPYKWAASIAAVTSYYGNIDPARQLRTLILKGIRAPKVEDRFTEQEKNLLLHDGISTYDVDSGGLVRIQRLITTYQESATGADDVSYLDVNTLLTLSYLRYDFRNHISRKFPRHKLADDGKRYNSTQAIITPKVGKAEAVAKFRQWEDLGLIELGDTDPADAIICVRNPQDVNRLDWQLKPDLINNFMIAGVQIQFVL